MPSILFVNRVGDPRAGATARLVDDLAVRLARSGWRVTILACAPWCGEAGPAEPLPVLGAGCVRRVRAPAPSGRGLSAAAGQVAALARAALALPVQDVAVALSDPPLLATLGPALRRRAGTLIHWCHDLYPDLLPIVAGARGAAVAAVTAPAAAAALRSYDGILAAAPCLAERLRPRLRGGPPVAVLENWPDPAVRPDPAAGEAWRARLGLRAGSIVMYAGTLGRVHRVGALIDAVGRLARRDDVALVLAGAGGEGRDRLCRAAVRRGLAPPHAVPWQPAGALSGLLSAADLHLALLDDRAEGLSAPCKVATAHAAGRPVLFAGPAGAGPARRIARTGAGGVVAPAGEALAEAVDRFADDAAWRREADAAARAVRPALDADGAARRFEAALDGFAARRRPVGLYAPDPTGRVRAAEAGPAPAPI